MEGGERPLVASGAGDGGGGGGDVGWEAGGLFGEGSSRRGVNCFDQGGELRFGRAERWGLGEGGKEGADGCVELGGV